MTPLSQIISIIIFVPFTLFVDNYISFFLQGILIIVTLLIFKIGGKGFSLRDFIPLIPVILFVFILNSFRGGGEIFFKIGPIMVVKQGIRRGIYYSILIMELFVMSKVLTRGYSHDLLLSTLYSIDRYLTCSFFLFKKENTDNLERDFILILYYVLKIFDNTYSEIRVFLKKGKGSLKERSVQFIYTVFRKSLSEYDNLESYVFTPVKPNRWDFLFISIQISLLVAAIFIKKAF